MVLSWRRAIALLLIVLTLGLTSCGGDRDVPIVLLEGEATAQTTNPLVGAMAEVSPPERIQQLKPYLDVYEPQVHIVSPRPNETLNDTRVEVELQVRDFHIYKDQDLGLGPHLHLFLDDQPYQAVYETNNPVTFTDLAPGTHTLRVFASRPWHESFKNEGAYDQITFNIFAPSPINQPDDSKALLTYSRPQGSYGTEPIMLDFYLTNAPLHIVAAEDESMLDWRIRCTVNGEAFVFDRWQPIYLKGFQPGTNWVKLELIDENGNLIDNAFNTGLRLIEYTPGGDDGLAKLVRGEISLAQAKVLVDPNYEPPVPVVPEAPVPLEESEEALSSDRGQKEAPASKAEEAPATGAVPEEEVPQEKPAEPTVEEQASEESEAPTEEAPDTKMVPAPVAPTAESETPMPTSETPAEPGMLPEIIGEPEQLKPEVETPAATPNPAETESEESGSADAIAPSTLDSEEPASTKSEEPESVPSVEPETAPIQSGPNALERLRRSRQRSRFGRERASEPETAQPSNETGASLKSSPQVPTAPSLEETPESTASESTNGTATPSPEPSSIPSEEADAADASTANSDSGADTDLSSEPSETKPAIDSLEGTSDVI